MLGSKESGCAKLFGIAVGMASILGVGIALCAWLFPLSPFSPVETPVPTVLPPDPTQVPPTACVWSLDKGRLAAIRFYESGIEEIALEQRMYTDAFTQATARYINWELTIDFGCPAPAREAFIIEVAYYKPDGTIDGYYSQNTYVEQGWPESVHFGGWGFDEPGGWEPGRYQVGLRVGGLASMEVSSYFDIEP